MQYQSNRYNKMVMVIKMYFRRLKELREDHDYTQKYVASILHISQNNYSDIERGVTNISIEFLITLANLYDVSIDFIVERKTS